jgi:hypothetical protein
MICIQTENGSILEGLAMEDVGIFGAILPILLPNVTFCGQMVHLVVV